MQGGPLRCLAHRRSVRGETCSHPATSSQSKKSSALLFEKPILISASRVVGRDVLDYPLELGNDANDRLFVIDGA